MTREENGDEVECGMKEPGYTGRTHMEFGTSEVLRERGPSHKTKKAGQRCRKATGKLIKETKQCLRSRGVGVGGYFHASFAAFYTQINIGTENVC